MTATKQTELLLCRNCGGQCDPTGWMCGDGRQGPECEGCGITTPDVESWNKLMAQSAPEPVQAGAFACTANKKGIAEQRSLWRDEQGADDWLAHMVGRGCITTKTPLYTAAAKADAELVALLARLRQMVCATPENDLDRSGVWISTKHPVIERIDAKLAEVKP